MASGIRDKVAIIGMGCSRFGERWESGSEELMIEAFSEALADAGIEKKHIEAAWLGSGVDPINLGNSAGPLPVTLRLRNIPVTRVENMCATGTEALRGATYAVASGACDIALALGVEKLKDTGYGGLPVRTKGSMNDLWMPYGSAPGTFAQLAGAYAARYGISKQDIKRAMAHISWKSHQNGTKNKKAHLQKAVTMEQILNAPMIAEPLGLFDCCGVSDGAACAIVTTPEIAKSLGKSDIITIKSLQLALSDGTEMQTANWDGSYMITTRVAAKRAYAEAGISDPKKDISMTEVHDCFSITELVTMEDLGLSDDGRAVFDVLDGKFDATGAIPCQTDGGLKCFGHPIGASGLRMVYENYLQLLGRAGERQLKDPKFGLTHNLGGTPYNNVACLSIIGHYR
jgi:acetyl-CoA C-acetyltransferase